MAITRTHLCDGTVGANPTVAGEGCDAITNATNLTYAAGGYAGTALQTTNAAIGFLQDDVATTYAAVYVKLPAALPATCNIVYILDSAAAGLARVGITSTGAVQIGKSFSNTIANSTATLTPGIWYRLEVHVEAGTVTVRLYDADSDTVTEEISGAANSANAPGHWRFGAANATSGGPVHLDGILLGDAWIGDSAGPVASFTHTETDLTVTVDASATTGGNITGYDWDWGDGSAHDTSATASHTYTTSGTYDVTLTVTNALAATSTSSASVAVAAPVTLTRVRGVIAGGVEVPAAVRGVIAGGVEVAATVREVVGGTVPTPPGSGSPTYTDTYTSAY